MATTFQEVINLPNGLKLFRGRITGAGSSDETDAITDWPIAGIIRRADFRLSSGSGATILPKLTRTTAVYTVPDLVLQPSTTAAATQSVASAVPFYVPDRQVYLLFGFDTGSDNVGVYEIYVDAGARQ